MGWGQYGTELMFTWLCLFPQLPQKNGQLSTVNGVAEQGDVHVQEENQEGQEEEVVDEDGKLPLQARLILAGHWRLHL